MTSKKKQVEVHAVAQNGPVTLAEWSEDGLAKRGYLPNEVMEGGVADAVEFEKAVPFGVPWEEFKIDPIDPAVLAGMLRKYGIWTAADLNRNTVAGINALRDAYGITVKHLRAFAESYERGE